MTDIVSVDYDIGLFDTQTSRAANLLSVQLGALEYAQDLGIDLAYFLSSDFKFQNESFRAYLVNRLAQSSINVTTVTEIIDNLSTTLKFNLSADNTTTGLIAR